MALLTDGNPNATTDLQVYESAILDVAATEMIDLGGKLGLATEEISEDVLDILIDHAPSTDPQAATRRMIGVSDVVVSPQMKRWHALHTLEIVYRDAFNNQLNDRYQAKMTEYQRLSKDARDHTMKLGIGLVTIPIPEAATPALTTAASPGAPDTTYYVAVSWVASAGAEGEPSEVTTFETPAETTLAVQAVNPPAVATGFNVYLGLSSTTLTLQNGSPIAVGQSFIVPASGLIAGAAPGNGQSPDTYVVGGPTLRRG